MSSQVELTTAIRNERSGVEVQLGKELRKTKAKKHNQINETFLRTFGHLSANIEDRWGHYNGVIRKYAKESLEAQHGSEHFELLCVAIALTTSEQITIDNFSIAPLQKGGN